MSWPALRQAGKTQGFGENTHDNFFCPASCGIIRGWAQRKRKRKQSSVPMRIGVGRTRSAAAAAMVCTRGQSDNQAQNKFCENCAAPLAPSLSLTAGGMDTWACARRPKTQTRLRCGRCEAPICPRCTVHTPAGMRCRPCAHNKVAVRSQALLHEAGRLASRGTQALGPRAWHLTLWCLILSLFRGWGE